MRISTLGILSKRLRISEFGFRNIKTKKEIKEQIKIRILRRVRILRPFGVIGLQSAIRNGFTPLEINLKENLVSNKTARVNEKIRMFPIGYGNVKKHFLSLTGFTLLEISLVILVIGIILSLVLPNIGIHKSKLEKERQIEKISQTIKSVYDLSQIQNKEIVLSFNLDENKFQAVSLIDGDEEFLLPEKKLSSALKIKDIVNFKGDKITEGTISLVFNPAGFVEPATIHFIDSDSKFYTLFINPLTGQSRIENGYWEEEMI